MKEKMQRLGGFLAGMIIPNLGAFIAWGLITALFIPTGWTPNEQLSELVGPMIVTLLPVLIGYTGGKMIHGVRGGVVGATVTMGVIVGTDVPQFMGAMVMGPLGGWLIKKVDDALEDKVPVGFEMLVNNFSAGILATIVAIFGYYAMSPILTAISNAAGGLVDWLVNAKLLPLAAIVIEPAKVLFLNNALNHGVLTPLGAAAAEETGRAIHFLLETNPGPGLGLLAAFYFAGKGLLKDSAPGAMIIHFLGGIHEIYFPYVLAHPIMILAMIAGGLSADLWFTIFNAGLVASPSPGSIFAYLAVIPKGQHFAVLTGVLIGAVVSFLVGSLLLKVRPVREEEDEEEEEVGAAVPGLG
ncbi:MAG: PTS mannitol transporter subunit IICB [Anaerolineae bacterium]|mgnify:FL=1|jgi:PTS system mannitol-specific IIC component|nr:PTS mannitol transporter subunit IICB [Anaerolineae bacterium]MBT4311340.1 PTS mannitol transporter subunit IICB [Anaerolineae bacterium]MBT4459030.1 PTS mannitol transporter subunit IICB [Anaerolineae bacterium]MBT6059602.1 PTS mannitol transporter subunit IICB [Anaerolineae bacterium]MBT6323285.1 PTS mannitol transporter subunit IICB [Anaerolineae bacterium]